VFSPASLAICNRVAGLQIQVHGFVQRRCSHVAHDTLTHEGGGALFQFHLLPLVD